MKGGGEGGTERNRAQEGGGGNEQKKSRDAKGRHKSVKKDTGVS
jgi:hypothetical protein